MANPKKNTAAKDPVIVKAPPADEKPKALDLSFVIGGLAGYDDVHEVTLDEDLTVRVLARLDAPTMLKMLDIDAGKKYNDPINNPDLVREGQLFYAEFCRAAIVDEDLAKFDEWVVAKRVPPVAIRLIARQFYALATGIPFAVPPELGGSSTE